VNKGDNHTSQKTLEMAVKRTVTHFRCCNLLHGKRLVFETRCRLASFLFLRCKPAVQQAFVALVLPSAPSVASALVTSGRFAVPLASLRAW
jgi:hypothetical protein